MSYMQIRPKINWIYVCEETFLSLSVCLSVSLSLSLSLFLFVCEYVCVRVKTHNCFFGLIILSRVFQKTNGESNQPIPAIGEHNLIPTIFRIFKTFFIIWRNDIWVDCYDFISLFIFYFFQVGLHFPVSLCMFNRPWRRRVSSDHWYSNAYWIQTFSF